ncbi:MAG TPA: maleylpyruvate isomerase N-terminal domain-containing protein [Longimicrobiaceae bacterium]
MEPIPPLYTADLFPPLHGELIGLLRGLSPEDWERPTVAGRWHVRDIVAHLLDIDLRKLSVNRDGHLAAPAEPIRSHEELMRFLNGLNAEWIGAARRLSPRVLVELHSFTGPLVSVRISGEAGDAWSLVRGGDGWELHRGAAPDPAVAVTLDPDSAWRLLYNALPAREARERSRVEGDAPLAEPLFAMRSVMV